eukprot:CAMPEP_0174306340 /NCGR_PEP_ID=MMETSP0810-20121108/385_1 /TAXON_ID=73025 ORGANISM="Eutreptiella gymnastica-like, Strain CCMP1594" /NCGR_SAMPLE_ID=MMETSP0810 /ASSEMBLY_ACC=CAM_ASM_000659 /LENGTH=63 /DNA_ID=CAMNT_0015413021 /DNA_START=315 /DNA_END=506 /DNA_ORIENTATION=+
MSPAQAEFLLSSGNFLNQSLDCAVLRERASSDGENAKTIVPQMTALRNSCALARSHFAEGGVG